MTPWFNSLTHVNWNRVWIVVAAAGVVWGGLAAIVPAKYHTPVMVVLGAVQSGFTFILRSSKYVETRNEIPRPGEVP